MIGERPIGRDFSTGFKIGDKTVGHGAPTYVIAEIGSNHDQSLDQAKALIDAAAEAGADAAKFQSIRFDRIHLPERCEPELHDLFAKIDLPEEWYPELAEHCRARGVDFLSSITYEEAIDLLLAQDVGAFKIASAQFDIHPEIVAAAARTGRPLIMSAGLADLHGVARTLDLVASAGAREVVLLHCLTRYPAPASAINLRAVATLSQEFGVLTGFSDHTLELSLAPAAVALGAVVIEKHMTLDRDLPGPDHHFAVLPEEFAAMVEMIREVESAMGDGVKPALDADELAIRRSVTPKWVAAEDIPEGTPLTRDRLIPRRCDGGIAMSDWTPSSNNRAARSIKARTPLEWSDLKG
jgi:sialic acid synthase SpsE